MTAEDTPQFKEGVFEQFDFDFPPLDDLDLGSYKRSSVSNLDGHNLGRAYFDFGLCFMYAFNHELAAKYFLASLQYSPNCALAHGFVALCHAPNYNFKGLPYYMMSYHDEDATKPDLECMFPSQHVANRHGIAALKIVEKQAELDSLGSNDEKEEKTGREDEAVCNQERKDGRINEVESHLLQAIHIMTCKIGIAPESSNQLVEIPYANAMEKIYQQFGEDDPEIVYFYVDSLMIKNAWKLYQYPSGKPATSEVNKIRDALEKGLKQFPDHPGLCHLYVHLMEMSATPELALDSCAKLRKLFKHAGHLTHMPTHIDVLLGDYNNCVKYNEIAIEADMHVMAKNPSTIKPHSFYYAYITHNYHMAVYGCILGGYKSKAIELSKELNMTINEELLTNVPPLAIYIESYSSLDIHTMVRFGLWQEILETLKLPKNKELMLFRACQVHFARAIAYAVLNNIDEAKNEAKLYDDLMEKHADVAKARTLHNNSVFDLLQIDSVMMHGEIAYREEKYDEAFELLRKAIHMQDELNYDEPWGKMQPIRHALGGLLMEQKQYNEAEAVFRKDLELHPNNPWAITGLIQCLKTQSYSTCSCSKLSNIGDEYYQDEINKLSQELAKQQECDLADFHIKVACECCQH